MRSLIRTLGLALLGVSLPAISSAQPISFQLNNNVAQGKKPTLSITAVERVRGLKVDLTREDGVKFIQQQAQLAVGQRVVFNIGDGKPGRAHYQGKISLEIVEGEPWSYDLDFETLIRAPLSVTWDFEHLNLAGQVLRFQMSRAAGKAEISVTGEDGKELGLGEVSYHGESPGTWLPISWVQDPGRVMLMHLKVTSADGLVSAVELIPWSVNIGHEEVVFATGSAEISPAEASKLDASLVKIREAASQAEHFIKVRLYVAGHTDTVGTREHNRQLSFERAHAIARYFRAHGLTIPVSCEGFGEEALKVPTPDETDELRNRRADYVLADQNAPTPPAFKAAKINWKNIQ